MALESGVFLYYVQFKTLQSIASICYSNMQKGDAREHVTQ